MKDPMWRTVMTLVIAVGSAGLAAFLYATGRVPLLQALNGPFLVWVALDVWYGRKWGMFRKTFNRRTRITARASSHTSRG